MIIDNYTDWRRGTKSEEETPLLSLFADSPDAPFSIHRFVQHGAEHCGKHPGEWFGPSATALCIQYGQEPTFLSELRLHMKQSSLRTAPRAQFKSIYHQRQLEYLSG